MFNILVVFLCVFLLLSVGSTVPPTLWNHGPYIDTEGWSTVPWVRPYEEGLPIVHYLSDYLNVSANVPLGKAGYSYARPLVFMHQRKTGGSNIRDDIEVVG